MFEIEQKQIEENIFKFLQDNDIPLPENLSWRTIPFSGEWGLATSFFQIAAAEAKSGKKINVPARAKELATTIAATLSLPEGLSRAEGVNGYLNIFFETQIFSEKVIQQVIQTKENFGSGDVKNQKVMVEYSQPNTHKAMHVGHLRNMMLGSAISNILELAGYEVIRTNYIGDFGRDVMKWIWNYQKNHADETPPKDATKWMGELYAESNKELEENLEEGNAAIQTLFDQWEAGEEIIHNLWQKTRQWSLDGFDEMYSLLNIPFEKFYYESEMEAAGKAMVNKLLETNIATDERENGGTVVVKLDELLGNEHEEFRTMVVLRSDSTALYATWDLALAQKKFEDYDLDKSIYLVDVRQSLHFKQVFKTLELAGFAKINKAFHLPYEIVNLPGNVTMKSREGTVVLLEDLIREAINRATEVSLERNPNLDETTRKAVAKAVAIGAIKYPMLNREHTKKATFDWESALDFNGHAAPYLQYAHVRANSLLKKAGGVLPDLVPPAHDLEVKEISLIEQISQWPGIIEKAAEEYKTLSVSNHIYQLSKTFNEFYNACPVLKAEPAVMNFRLNLVSAAKQTISNGLKVLGIEAPEVM